MGPYRARLGLVAILMGSLIATDAGALLIEGTFSGTVNTSNDQTNFYGLGFGNTLGGMSLTGTFRYNTDQAGPDVYPLQDTFGTTGNYNGNTADWIQMSVTVAGITEQTHDGTNFGNATWDAVVLGPLFDAANTLTIIDATQNPASSVNDTFRLRSSDGSVGSVNSGSNNYIWGEQGILDLFELFDDSTIVTDGPGQQFTWLASANGSASGSFTINHQIRGPNESGVFSLLVNEQAGMTFTLSQVTASIVPEPSTTTLLALGLIVLAARGRTSGAR